MAVNKTCRPVENNHPCFIIKAVHKNVRRITGNTWVWVFWRRLQHVFEDVLQRRFEDVLKTSCKTSWRHLQDVLKTSWKTKNCYAEDVLKTCLEDMSWRCLEDILKILWRQTKYWGYLYTYLGITNLNVYLTSLYFTNLYLTILKRIQNALIRTQ